jgi:hypothetical protein
MREVPHPHPCGFVTCCGTKIHELLKATPIGGKAIRTYTTHYCDISNVETTTGGMKRQPMIINGKKIEAFRRGIRSLIKSHSKSRSRTWILHRNTWNLTVSRVTPDSHSRFNFKAKIFLCLIRQGTMNSHGTVHSKPWHKLKAEGWWPASRSCPVGSGERTTGSHWIRFQTLTENP